MSDPTHDAVAAFIVAACAPRDSGHASGTLDEANALLAAHPEIAGHDIHVAAILGDDAAVAGFLAADSANATATGGPHGWDPLTHLCFSRYVRLDPSRSAGFVRAATALLDAGASPNSGWWEPDHQPKPEWESVLYGAAGVAHHAELTQLLLDRGADPNDGETPYHVPESYDNNALKALVNSGKMTADSLGVMLLRKADWHDRDGLEWLLERGVDPNRLTHWGITAFHQALRRDNSLDIIKAFLDHGADPTLVGNGLSSVAIAAQRGRGDALELFVDRGISSRLSGVDQLLAACARGDGASARQLTAREPRLINELLARGGPSLGQFAGVGNVRGVELLLELGVDVDAVDREGDGYYDIAPNSTALHVSAWRALPHVVRLLIDRGASIEAIDGWNRKPLSLAVRACVDSFWTERRTTESIAALVKSGASTDGIKLPTGYPEADDLIRAHRA